MSEVSETPGTEGSSFILGLHVLMWTNLSVGLVALLVVVMLTRS
jgi:hypothetical protein